MLFSSVRVKTFLQKVLAVMPIFACHLAQEDMLMVRKLNSSRYPPANIVCISQIVVLDKLRISTNSTKVVKKLHSIQLMASDTTIHGVQKYLL